MRVVSRRDDERARVTLHLLHLEDEHPRAIRHTRVHDQTLPGQLAHHGPERLGIEAAAQVPAQLALQVRVGEHDSLRLAELLDVLPQAVEQLGAAHLLQRAPVDGLVERRLQLGDASARLRAGGDEGAQLAALHEALDGWDVHRRVPAVHLGAHQDLADGTRARLRQQALVPAVNLLQGPLSPSWLHHHQRHGRVPEEELVDKLVLALPSHVPEDNLGAELVDGGSGGPGPQQGLEVEVPEVHVTGLGPHGGQGVVRGGEDGARLHNGGGGRLESDDLLPLVRAPETDRSIERLGCEQLRHHAGSATPSQRPCALRA